MANDIKFPERELKVIGTSPVRPDGVPKVTGRAQYGADWTLPGMLWAKVLRSPHAHARIRSIDTSAAEALPGVKAVVTGKDFPEQKFDYVGPERVAINFWHFTRNVMAKEKALFDGHPVAAVPAATKDIADEALKLVDQAGFDHLHMAFYKNQDLGNDGIWDVWQIEGPSSLIYFRGAPHVHAYIHIRDKAEIG